MVQVAATAASIASVWGSLAVVCCAVVTTLHTVHCFPSVSPVAVQVAGTAARVLLVCPLAACVEVRCSSPHSEQECLVEPLAVHVGVDTTVVVDSLCAEWVPSLMQKVRPTVVTVVVP